MVKFSILETREGYDLVRGTQYIASFRSHGAAVAARRVEQRRKAATTSKLSHAKGKAEAEQLLA